MVTRRDTSMVGVRQNKGVPLPLVKLSRWVLVVGVVSGLLLQQPLFTTVLFVMMLSAVLFGRRGSLIFRWVSGSWQNEMPRHSVPGTWRTLS